MRRVAVLCARADSIYKGMRGVDVFDAQRDARKVTGPLPVVAHPPCAQWGRLRAFAHDKPAEKALGPFCVDKVCRWGGGVLEHPARSLLWAECGLPKPGDPVDAWGGWTVELPQFWLGHLAEKLTWLYVSGVPRLPPIQLPIGEPSHVIETSKRDGLQRPSVSKAMREATPLPMARWLLQVARSVGQ